VVGLEANLWAAAALCGRVLAFIQPEVLGATVKPKWGLALAGSLHDCIHERLGDFRQVDVHLVLAPLADRVDAHSPQFIPVCLSQQALSLVPDALARAAAAAIAVVPILNASAWVGGHQQGVFCVGVWGVCHKAAGLAFAIDVLGIQSAGAAASCSIGWMGTILSTGACDSSIHQAGLLEVAPFKSAVTIAWLVQHLSGLSNTALDGR